MVLRNTVKEDLGVTPAELLYGAPLSMVTDLVAPPSALQPQQADISIFRRQMAETTAATSRPNSTTTAPSRALGTATHVYIRDDRPKGKFEPKYNGPYRVVERHDRFYKIELSPDVFDTVSILRLKPALVESTSAQKDGQSILSLFCCGLGRAKQLSHEATGSNLKSALRRHEAPRKTNRVRFDLSNLPHQWLRKRKDNRTKSSAPLIVESSKRSNDSTGPASVVHSPSAPQTTSIIHTKWYAELMQQIRLCVLNSTKSTPADTAIDQSVQSSSISVSQS